MLFISRVQSAEVDGEKTDFDDCGNVMQFISCVQTTNIDGEQTDIDDCGNILQFVCHVQSAEETGKQTDIDDCDDILQFVDRVQGVEENGEPTDADRAGSGQQAKARRSDRHIVFSVHHQFMLDWLGRGGGGKRGRGWGDEREGVGVGSWKDKLLVIFSANLALMCVCEEEGTVAVLYNCGLCWA